MSNVNWCPMCHGAIENSEVTLHGSITRCRCTPKKIDWKKVWQRYWQEDDSRTLDHPFDENLIQELVEEQLESR